MGFFDSLTSRIKSDAENRAQQGVMNSISKGISNVANAKKAEKCPKCKKALPNSGLKFCPNCGEALILKCQKCGEESPLGTKFCVQCGSKF